MDKNLFNWECNCSECQRNKPRLDLIKSKIDLNNIMGEHKKEIDEKKLNKRIRDSEESQFKVIDQMQHWDGHNSESSGCKGCGLNEACNNYKTIPHVGVNSRHEYDLNVEADKMIEKIEEVAKLAKHVHYDPKDEGLIPEKHPSEYLYLDDVVEDFVTWQGEALYMGVMFYFLRFRVCKRMGNQPLCYYCDTQKRTSKIKPKRLYLSTLYNHLVRTGGKMVITGGEPTLYYEEIAKIFNYLDRIHVNPMEFLKNILIESNGYNYIKLYELLATNLKSENFKMILSPKIFNDTDLELYYDLLDAIKDHVNHDNVLFKILIGTDSKENSYSHRFIEWALDRGFDHSIFWIMPIGENIEQLNESYPFALEVADRYNFNLSSRMHIIHHFE